MLPEGECRCWRWRIVGHLVAAVFAAPARFAGKTFEIASDSVTGRQLEVIPSRGGGTADPYSRFSDEVLAASPFSAQADRAGGRRAAGGHADLDAMRQRTRSCTPSPAGWPAPAVPPSSGR
ncbi:hypothetical protein LNQ52_26975 [Klebsiella pneumoniae subsp. pneumoniae]|nr:hypothetical protein [Klebsiella pneumoniae subsp. pneumoniae]